MSKEKVGISNCVGQDSERRDLVLSEDDRMMVSLDAVELEPTSSDDSAQLLLKLSWSP